MTARIASVIEIEKLENERGKTRDSTNEIGKLYNELCFLNELDDNKNFIFGLEDRKFLNDFWVAYNRTFENIIYFSEDLINTKAQDYLNLLVELLGSDSNIEFEENKCISIVEVQNQFQNLKSVRVSLMSLKDYHSKWKKFSEKYIDKRLKTLTYEDGTGKTTVVFADRPDLVVCLNPAKVTSIENLPPFPQTELSAMFKFSSDFKDFTQSLTKTSDGSSTSRILFKSILEGIEENYVSMNVGKVDKNKYSLLNKAILDDFASLKR
jgi:hypothetical protein